MNRWIAPSAAALAAIAALSYPGTVNAQAITPELIAAAEKEGAVTWYTASELESATAMIAGFQKKYPKIKVTMERNGGERIFQRVGQEYASQIYNVDVISSSEIGHAVYWKKQGWLAKFVPEDVEKYWPKEMRHDKTDVYQVRTVVASIIAYNSELVKDADAPKSWKDLLDPKWKGKIGISHPAYSGTAHATVYLLSKELGWDYFTKLAGQSVMQLQSSGEPARKAAVGERLIGAASSEQVALQEIDKGAKLKIVYPSDGVPITETPTAIMAKAKNPNAARLYMSYLFSAEGQQINQDIGYVRGVHPHVKSPKQAPLSEIKILLDKDPENYATASGDLKKDYQRYFTAINK